MAIQSIGYDGSVNESQVSKWTQYLGRRAGVASSSAWTVTPVVGLDRTVRISAGVGFGDAIHDTVDATVDVQLAPIASGTRFDTIVARRDWTPPGGTTVFVGLTGVTAQQVAAGLLSNPGVTADQPIALVQLTAGQTTPTSVVDLRVDKDGRVANIWASNYHGVPLSDTGWAPITLASGWSAESFSVTPGYRRYLGQTELRGQARHSSGAISGAAISVGSLPVGFRPLGFTEIAVATSYVSTQPATARVEVSAGGEIKVSVGSSSSRTWISLDAVRFEARN